jgi:hypothetical protein
LEAGTQAAARSAADASLSGARIHRLTEFRFQPALIDRTPVDTVLES